MQTRYKDVIFHPSRQQVSWLDTETDDTGEQKLVQSAGDSERFYRQVAAPALLGREATGTVTSLP